jgi:hypothetical protein
MSANSAFVASTAGMPGVVYVLRGF